MVQISACRIEGATYLLLDGPDYWWQKLTESSAAK